MRNGWTGGQYSLFRGVFGAYLLVHFAHLVPWSAETFSSAGVLGDKHSSPLIHAFPNVLAVADQPAVVIALVASAAVAALFFAAGKFDRVAAIWMWYVLACLFGRNPLTANPSLPFVGWMLIAHCFMPRAPYGSTAAAGRDNPGNGWAFPGKIFLAAWIVMSLAYSYSGYTKLVSPSWLDGTAMRDVLENPLARDTFYREWILLAPVFALKLATWGALLLELLFAPLALVRVLRPWLWAAMLAMHFGLLAVIDFADLSLGMIMIHLFTFDPAWVRGRGRRGEGERVLMFYDGHCGLCHGVVRFILAEDGAGRIRFAPLQGRALESAIPDADRRAAIPDSIVLSSGEGADAEILMKSDAVIRLLAILGGYWRVLGGLMRIFPRPVRDYGYDTVARYRRRIFGSPPDACPLMPPGMRERFELD